MPDSTVSVMDFKTRILESLPLSKGEALDFFIQKGFPSVRDEEWKYTSLSVVLDTEWNLNVAANSLTKDEIKPFLVPGLDADVIVLNNGKFLGEVSHISGENEGVQIKSFSSALLENKDVVDAHLDKHLRADFNGLVALNTASENDGVFIHIGKNVKAKKSVQIIYFNTSVEAAFVQNRNLFIVEEGAEISIVEVFVSNNETAVFSNHVSEINVAENARLQLIRIQNENKDSVQINTTQLTQESSSSTDIHTYTTGGRLVRNDLNFLLGGKNIEAHLHGMYIPTGNAHFDNHTFVDHAQPNCFSNEFYKGIMKDKGRGVFNGKIMVRQDAQKTNAYQSNKNIILSPEAKADTKPQLEIFADDVKCSHGATVGQLDDEALFYLRSRGISEANARVLLTSAFTSDVLDKCNLIPVKKFVKTLIDSSLQ